MPCLVISDLIFLAAPSEISIMSSSWQLVAGTMNSYWLPATSYQLRVRLRVSCRSRHALVLLLFRLVVGNRRLDRILGQHRAVDLHRRQRQLSDDVGVLDRQRLIDGLALEPLGR